MAQAPRPPATQNEQLLASEKPWSTGTFACCSDADSCCLSCWCPCIQFGQNQERAFRSQHRTCCRWSALWMAPLLAVWLISRLAEMATGEVDCQIVCQDAHGLREVDSGADVLDNDCFKMCGDKYPVWVEVLEPLGWVAACIAIAVMAGRRRALLRSQHRIRGSLESDVVCHCLCGCCSLAQEARQIAAEELLSRQTEQSGVPSSHAAMPVLPAGGAPAAVGVTVAAQPAYAGAYYDAEAAVPAQLAQPIAQPVYSYEPGRE